MRSKVKNKNIYDLNKNGWTIIKANNFNKVDKIKLLGNGDIENKINIEVDFISKSAKEKIEKKGGSIKITTK